MLDYKLLIICICIVIVLTLYLFFWNRLVGFALGRIFRILFRNQGESSCWVDIGTLQRVAASQIHIITLFQAPFISRFLPAEYCSRICGTIPATKVSELSRVRLVGGIGLELRQAKRT